ncbi:MAG: MFS transporter [Thermoplasmata archaeon]|nr:MFS transporter [Candidatus Sysuiplasma jiujiangense]
MPKIPFLFFRFLVSKMLVSILFSAFTVFFLWEIVETYHSVFLAGLVATIYLVVQMLVSVPVGHMIDRMNSTVIGMIGSVIVLLSPLLLTTGYTLQVVYSSTVLITVGWTMKGDSFSATIKKHLSEDQFMASNSFNLAATYAASLTGTALGGAAILYFARLFPYLLLVTALASLLLSMPVSEEMPRRGHSRVVGELASSLAFFRKIVGFLVIAFVLNGLFMALDVYSSGLFHIILHSNAIFYTLFVMSIPVGGIFGSFLANFFKNSIQRPFTVASLVLLFAPMFLVLGISRNAVADVIDALLLGLLLPVINLPLNVKLMKIVPSRTYGKIMAFLRIFVGGSTPAMAALFSFIAIYFPVSEVLLYVGILLFPLTGLSYIVLPRFMNMRPEED